MRGKERRERVKLATLDVNFQDIDKCVPYKREYTKLVSHRKGIGK